MEKLSSEMKAYLARIGRKGGAKGGKAVWASMTPTQRSLRARKMLAARWAKVKPKQAA